MIRIELSWLVFVCLLVCLAGIFFVWIGYEIARRHQAKRALRHRLRCPVCSMEYEENSPSALAVCPRCGSLNERAKPAYF